MKAEKMQQLLDEIAENRKQHEENYRALQRSLFLFKTGLLHTNRKLARTADRFAQLTGPDHSFTKAA